MTTVQTVTGPVDGADLGRTLVHEHIRISYEGETLDPTYSWDRAETVERAVDKMGELLDAGFRTFVDPCPIELGRDPELYAEIASRSGMQIVCTTGFYTEHLGWGLPVYWRARDPEEIAELYVQGAHRRHREHRRHPRRCDQGRHRHRGDRRPSRAASPAPRSPSVRSAAPSSRTPRTRGTATCSRTSSPTAAPTSVACSSATRTSRPMSRPIRKLAERGTFVGIDRIGLEIIAPDERRADHVAALVREGYTSQVCLSQDHICALTAPRPSFYVPPENREAAAKRREQISWQVWQRPYTYIVTDFAPKLIERGVTDADLETIFVDNPRRLLTGS